MEQNDFRLILSRQPRRFEVRRVVFHILGDLLIWAAIVALARQHALWAGLLDAVLFSIFIFRAFAFMHECVHGCAHSQRKMNNALGHIYGVLSFLPFTSWRQLHLDHHMWSGNVEKDPSMKILAGFEKRGFKTPRVVGWSWVYWVPFLGFMQHLVFWTATMSKREYFFVASAIAYLGFAGWAMGLWPLITGLLLYLYLVEIINFPHHLGLTQYGGEARFSTREQSQFTRSCVYPKWLAHNVFLNFNLHTEHHIYPSHPWYQLDAIHAELIQCGELFNFSRGNEWILRNRRRQVDELFLETFAGRGEAAKADVKKAA
jgi:acyl-lipid omega-6 desaturase (Delta-12 desaturase)